MHFMHLILLLYLYILFVVIYTLFKIQMNPQTAENQCINNLFVLEGLHAIIIMFNIMFYYAHAEFT